MRIGRTKRGCGGGCDGVAGSSLRFDRRGGSRISLGSHQAKSAFQVMSDAELRAYYGQREAEADMKHRNNQS
jgi:hypothetical protein